MAHRSFVQNPEALPDDIAGTVHERAAHLRALGQSEELAAIGARLTQAGDFFRKADAPLVEALRLRFPERYALVTSPRLDDVHTETIAVTAKAQGEGNVLEVSSDEGTGKLSKKNRNVANSDRAKGLFDHVEQWCNDTESIVICSIKVGKNDYRYYLIDQNGTGKLTDIDKLEAKSRKKRRLSSYSKLGAPGPVMGCISLAIVLMVVVGLNPWWLLVAAVIGVAAWFVSVRHKVDTSQRSALAASTILATLISMIYGFYALNKLETTDRTAQILACKVESVRSDWDHQYDWVVKTPQGDFKFDAGTYSGKFYSDINAAAKSIQLGTSYEVVYHGGNIGSKYITEMKPINSIGMCG